MDVDSVGEDVPTVVVVVSSLELFVVVVMGFSVVEVSDDFSVVVVEVGSSVDVTFVDFSVTASLEVTVVVVVEVVATSVVVNGFSFYNWNDCREI